MAAMIPIKPHHHLGAYHSGRQGITQTGIGVLEQAHHVNLECQMGLMGQLYQLLISNIDLS